MFTETIHRDALRRIVDSFYNRVRDDEVLGPVFAAQVADWPVHLERMTCFWASAILRERSYSGHPLQIHQRIPGLTVTMFDTWLTLFESAVRNELGDSEGAQVMIDMARRMAGYMVQNLRTPQGLTRFRHNTLL